MHEELCMLLPYHTFNVIPSLPPRLTPLRELVYNLWWTWNLDAVDLIRRLDRDLWEDSGHNPVFLLGTIPQERLEEAANDEGFQAHMMRIYQALNRYMGSSDTWFKRTLATKFADLRIAYFSAEFGLTECLPMYSGGLGILAGDHLKSSSDLGIPLVGVGLLYQQGYARQYLNADGWQQELYPVNDFYTMPIQLERGSDGNAISVQVDYPGRVVTAQVWRAQVGRVPLYLLDTNLDANRPEDRAITGQLYGGDLDTRIRQEIMLGIGGMRALAALGIEPTVCHMNEGHSAFLALERIRRVMREQHLTFAEAKELTSAGNMFTTHTAVPAGFDLFPPQMMDYYFGNYYHELNLGREEFLQLGRGVAARPDESFSMAVLALHLAASANGVSVLHGEVARNMWKGLWPQTPTQEVPITSITNGIHTQSWISHDLDSLFLRYLGPRWVERPWEQAIWERIERIPDEELWRTHERRRERLVAIARDRLRKQFERRGAAAKEVAVATEVLDPEVLTIVFARRFATYKRALLLFSDPERLSRILNDRNRPVQIIFAGKSHPQDNPGKEFIRQIVHFSRREDMRRRVIFLEDYDMSLARYLVQGADVWLNTPRPGWEASGTSGMKAAMNGALNVSSYDGWWREGYKPEIGWCVGRGEFYEDERYGDQVEAQALYDLLEKDIIPLFYERGQDGLPRNWIARMKHAMRKVAPQFNTHRMVQEYIEDLVLPASLRYRKLASDNFEAAKGLAAWMEGIRRHWGEIRILGISSDAEASTLVGAQVAIRASIALGSLKPQDVAVQVFFGSIGSQREIVGYDMAAMTPVEQDANGNYVYSGALRCSKSGLHGYAVRVLPYHPDLSDPYVPGLVLWSS
jgi:glycogen phosphorylase